MFKYIFLFSMFFVTEAFAMVSAETGRRNQALGQAQTKCAEEIAKTGQSTGAVCQSYRKQLQEYDSYFKENECSKSSNASLTRCRLNDKQIEELVEKNLAKKVEKAKQQQEAALKSAAEPEVDEVQPQAVEQPAKTEEPKQKEIVGMASPAKAEDVTDPAAATGDSTPAKTTPTTANSSSSSSGLFGTLIQKGAEVFTGLREIIFAVAGFGITAVAIGGFFGNLNWKWLSAIIIGLLVVSTASAIINYMVDSDAVSETMITDTLISAR